MYSHTIYIDMIQDPYCNPYFRGAYPYDKVDSSKIDKNTRNIFMINTTPSYKKYGHWVLYFIDNDSLYYFDSFSRDTRAYGTQFHQCYEILTKNYKVITISRQVQSYKSNLCGEFCTFVAKKLCRGETINMIFEYFSNELIKNDKVVLTQYG